MTPVTRFAPSPTGHLHIGSARTALFGHLFAASKGGTMYLRFEDTDRERSKPEYEDDILDGLEWLGIPYTLAEPLRQSERLDAHRAYLSTLIERGVAYEAEEGGRGGKVVRFKNPNVRVAFTDLVRGEVSFDTGELKDFVIARNMEEPLFHLAVVADDHDMGVTHVVRGEDHLSNTPRQILILEGLGLPRPTYAHIPLILAPDRGKLSKRHGAVSVNEYRKQGYLPEALVNYLALLGWNPGTDRELYTLRELVRAFSIEQVQKGGAIFDAEKLRWFNREHLMKLPSERFLDEVRSRTPEWSADIAVKLVPLLKERIEIWSDLDAAKGEYDFFFSAPAPDAEKIPGKESAATEAILHLARLIELLAPLASRREATPDDVKSAVWQYASEEGRGAVLWPMRYALTGRERSPNPFTVASVIGVKESIKRLKKAKKILRSKS